LLAPTIQADAHKKRAIQANASAWIGLIVDNYVVEEGAMLKISPGKLGAEDSLKAAS
jgi:hypothetical protein